VVCKVGDARLLDEEVFLVSSENKFVSMVRCEIALRSMWYGEMD
jgi:hypothetical protein